MDVKKEEILVSQDPLPLEQADPDLAEHIRLIANRQHPTVRALSIHMDEIRIFRHNGVVKIIRLMQRIGRNDPCYCGSGKKWKKCHGR